MPENINYYTICSKALSGLSPKHKEVLSRRFGLAGYQKSTLQEIGDSFGITRERVRQIERDGLIKAKSQIASENLQKAYGFFDGYLSQNGGLKREDLLLDDLGKDKNKGCVKFLLALSDSLFNFTEDENFFSFWAKDSDFLAKAQEATVKIKLALEKNGGPIKEKEIPVAEGFSIPFILSCVEVAKVLDRGPMAEIGFSSWPQINPRGVRDIAYLALREKQQPMHFREVAKFANQLLVPAFWQRKVLPQTIHNELIRDERFILVGRGMYGLQEWGYQPGTIKQVISNILKNGKGPLSREEVLAQAQKQRVVKPETIFLSLSDKKFFQRNKDGQFFVVKNV